ncbi:MAG: ATP-binding cassette domain-containing protein [Desulfarculus sp.]|nr:ATP-binding cassette domain-containing protein [Desulfarculus sp.]
MGLISLCEVSLAFGGPLVLDAASFQVQEGERVCLLGRNGAGKSSLLRILAGVQRPDQGQVNRAQGLEIGHLPQDVPPDLGGTVYELAAQGLGGLGRALIALRRGQGGDLGLEPAQEQEIWRLDHQLQAVITRLGLSAETRVETLSGGLQRRALLARALAARPGLLLLDEPTNHLDIDTIAWLEQFLLARRGAMVFVSHDRAFARALATRVVELDRGTIYDWKCPYDEFLRRREEHLLIERERREKFDRKLAQEEEWLHRGIKARRTRDEGRVRRLLQMRAERAQRRDLLGSARMQTAPAQLSGRVVAEAKGVAFAYADQPVFRDFSTVILRGDKLGIIGPNGSGKTTLLKVLLGQLPPQAGEIKLGANLEAAYFDQMRAELDPDRSVQDNLSDGQESLLVGGRPRHVVSYLKDFLFTPDRAHSPVRVLSGGERNRLLLAKLFARPANLLVLDEPTNDLDRDTLELLETLLVEFAGTVLVVSHDRQFLNNVAAGILALEGDGLVREYAGGYDDYRRQRGQDAAPQPVQPVKKERPRPPRPDQPRRLTYQQKQELAALPARIEGLEAELARLHDLVADPSWYAAAGKQVAAVTARIAELDAELERAFATWEELERLSQPNRGD